MIILDTNVLSELLRPTPDLNLVSWLDSQLSTQVFTTAITEAEIRYGVARIDHGLRRDKLLNAINGIFGEDLAGRILPFDSEAAVSYAHIVSERERNGRPIIQFDAQICAIAMVHGADIATRNVKDFEYSGIRILNPWAAV